MRAFRTAIVTASAIATALILTAGTAAAVPTDNQRISGSGSRVLTRVCVDRIGLDFNYDEMMHTFFNQAGEATRMQFTGKVVLTYTDLANGRTYSPNSSGPGTVDLASGQSIVRGSNGGVFNSDGIFVATNGRIIYDADGNIISIVGHQQPVCEALGTVSRS